WDRRRRMIAADLVRAAAVASLPFLERFGLAPLVAVALVLGAFAALFTPALHASLPALVGSDQDDLLATNGLMDTTARVARAVGPSVAAVLATRTSIVHLFPPHAPPFSPSPGAPP